MLLSRAVHREGAISEDPLTISLLQLFGPGIPSHRGMTHSLMTSARYSKVFKHYLKTNFEVYKYNAKLNMSYDKTVIEWCPYQQLIDV